MAFIMGVLLLVGGMLGVAALIAFRAERARLHREFEAEMRVRTTLVRAAAHELRQPINGISGLVESLKAGAAARGELRREVASRLDQSLEELNDALVRALELFDLSRGELALRPAPADLRSETRLLLKRINARLAEEGAVARVLGGHLPELWVRVDAQRLRQCLSALIDQAVSQSRDGVIRVACRVQDVAERRVRITFSVRDRGRGIDQRLAQRFFDPAVYEGNPLLRGRPGAMMALHLAERLAASMGGGITAESAPGCGTTFFFSIEADTCPGVGEPADDQPHDGPFDVASPSFGNLSVLLVDDHEISLFVLREFLQPFGFGRIVCAAGGQDAVDRAAEEPFDLILMDLAMPGVDGFDAARAIRSQGASANAPIIAVSADHIPPDDPRLGFHGIDGFLAKPVSHDALAETVLTLTPRILANALARGVEVTSRPRDVLPLTG